jgi:hypothetical protein
MDGTHQLLICADDIAILGENMNITNRNTEVLLQASREVGLGVTSERTKYVVMSRHQNAQ